MRILAIGDIHQPATKKQALDFCRKIYKEQKCDTVVLLGDVFDLHRASFHDHDPDMPSLRQEIDYCRKEIKEWVKAFPKAYLCEGNHDLRIHRVARKAGLTEDCIKSISEIFELPKTWQWADEWILDGVLYRHVGKPGPKGPYETANCERMSVVYGHIHSFAGISWTATKNDLLFGFNVGWLGDEEELAFRYGRGFTHRGVVGVGTIFDGKHPTFHPMDLGSKVKRVEEKKRKK